MTTIQVSLRERSYAIVIANSYRQLPEHLRQLGLPPWGWILSHPSLMARFGRQLTAPLQRAGWRLQTLTVPESERSKSYGTAGRVLNQLARRTAMRTPVMFAFGGGVIGDLAGFVAAVFRRGIPCVHLPTTLLAQVDSAIGGKTGVDLPAAKNLVGVFSQPRLVFSHLGLLASLPARQRRSGLSEIIKYAVIADPALFRYLEAHLEACLAGELRADRVMVERCARIKARIVSADEREQRGLRTHLNFGHTLGHALEAATGYRRLTHGEAIAVGMACASRISVELGCWPPSSHARLVQLLHRTGLPSRTASVRLSSVKDALLRDKKFTQGTMRWVLPTRIGRVMVHDRVPPALVWGTIRQHGLG